MNKIFRGIAGPLAGVILVGLEVGDSTVIAHIESSSGFRYGHAVLTAKAIRSEKKYIKNLIDFEEIEHPPFPEIEHDEFNRLGILFDVHRVVCAVALDTQGRILCGRNYQRVEMTVLYAIRDTLHQIEEDLSRFPAKN